MTVEQANYVAQQPGCFPDSLSDSAEAGEILFAECDPEADLLPAEVTFAEADPAQSEVMFAEADPLLTDDDSGLTADSGLPLRDEQLLAGEVSAARGDAPPLNGFAQPSTIDPQSSTIDHHGADAPRSPLGLDSQDGNPQSAIRNPQSIDTAAVRSGFSSMLVSIVLHLWLVLALSSVIRETRESLYIPPIDTRIVDATPVEEPEQVIKYELANPEEKELEVREVINAASVGLAQMETPQKRSEPVETRDILPTEVVSLPYDIPEGMQVDDRLVVKGLMGESLMQIESALDRVTWEIAQNLQERKVLVVWLLDASGSLTEQRLAVARRLRRIYGELNALERVEQVPRLDQPLLTGVVAFGQQTTFLTREPTDNFDAIFNAVQGVPIDESGVENTFGAVAQVMDKWKTYRAQNGRRIMVVIVTDEAGDDFSQSLEPAIARCTKYGARSYVIGPAAVFGRRQGFIPYLAPENNRTYQIPVDLGPETPKMTNVNIPFWFNGPQYTYISSGFAPYALARLVSETGGVYFTTNMTTMAGLSPTGVFDAGILKPFQPDYSFSTDQQFQAMLSKHPLRKAVVEAARLSMQYQAKGTPQMMVRVTPNNFKEQLSDAQKTVAESQLMIDNILAAFPPGIENQYATEPSLRWRVSFSLAYGRLLAQKVRCLEYNYCLAKLKNDYSTQDITTRVNEFRFQPDVEVKYAQGLRRQEEAALKHLQLVIAEAPGTPWAVLASRELQDPLGIRVEERFNPPPQVGRTNAQPTTKTLQIAPDPQNRPTPTRPTPVQPKLPKL